MAERNNRLPVIALTAALAGGPSLAGGADTQKELSQLNNEVNPEVATLQAMRTVGFTADAMLGDGLFRPVEGKPDTYELTLRLRNGESGDCKEFSHKKLGETTVCKGEVVLAENFQQQLAGKGVEMEDFWGNISNQMELPPIGGGTENDAKPPRVTAVTYQGNPVLGTELFIANEKVWNTCWNPENKSSKNLPKNFEGKKLSRRDCGDAKSGRSDVEVAQAQQEAAQAQQELEENWGINQVSSTVAPTRRDRARSNPDNS